LRDEGTTGTPAIVVNQGATVGRANVFPWVKADANGHVAVVWLGAKRGGNANNAAVMEPCASGSTTCMTNWAQWQVFVAESVNANEDFDGAGVDPPIFVQRLISDHVIHRGTVSTGGLGGSANRNLGDLFQIAFDPLHRANVAFSDDSKLSPLTITGHTGNDDPQARRLIRANFTYQMTANPGNCATFKGNAKMNGQPGYRYTVNACDNFDPGAGKDTFGIGVTGPNNFVYSKGPQPITEGNIQAH